MSVTIEQRSGADNTAEELLVGVDRRGAVAYLTLNRANKYNALSRAMMASLKEALANLASDPDVRVVVLAAEGKAFSAGHTSQRWDPTPTSTTCAHCLRRARISCSPSGIFRSRLSLACRASRRLRVASWLQCATWRSQAAMPGLLCPELISAYSARPVSRAVAQRVAEGGSRDVADRRIHRRGNRT